MPTAICQAILGMRSTHFKQSAARSSVQFQWLLWGIMKALLARDSTYLKAKDSIEFVRQWEAQKLIKIVRRSGDIPLQPVLTGPIPVILSIEGGDALGTEIERLDEFYGLGVRMITLVHGTSQVSGDNQIGNDMRQHSSAGDDDGLSDFGNQVVRRMNRLGMVIDVAHASTQTLEYGILG